MTRRLTETEIDDILDFIKIQKGIPYDTAISIVNKHKDRLRKQLVKQLVYDDIIPSLKELIMKNFNDSKIDPGESVGIICAQSLGEKNTQCSVSPSECVLVKIKNKILKTSIGEFIDTEMNKGNIDLGYGSCVKDVSHENIMISTVTPDGSIEWKEITELSRHLPKGDLIKVVTESGRHVTTTLSHSLLTRKEDKVVPILGSDLRVGHRMPSIRHSPIPQTSDTSIKISDYLPHETLELSTIPETIQLNNYFGWFMGAYLANGTSSDGLVIITDLEGEVEKHVTIFLNQLGISYQIAESIDNIEYSTKICKVSSVMLCDLMTSLCGDPSNTKVPEFVYGSNKEFILCLLHGYISSGGFVSEDGNIKTKSTCLTLLEDIRFLFTFFGIYSTLLEQPKIEEELTVYQLSVYERIKLLTNSIRTDPGYAKLQSCHQILQKDIVWDKIIRIELIREEDYEHKYVYDFSVEGNETFALFSGIVVHNTLNTLSQGKSYKNKASLKHEAT